MPHYHNQPEIRSGAVIIAKPKIVYTAPPVKKAKKRKAKKEKTDEPTVEKPVAAAAEESVPEYEPSPMVSLEEETGMSGMDMEELGGDMDDEVGTAKKGKAKKKKVVRTAAGTTWEDDSLLEWETGWYGRSWQRPNSTFQVQTSI